MNLLRRPFLASLLPLPFLGRSRAASGPATPPVAPSWAEEPGFVHGVQERRYRLQGLVPASGLGSRLEPLVGCTNLGECFGVPGGHLLFRGFHFDPMGLRPGGEILGKLTVDVAVSRIGWNNAPHPATRTPALIVDSAGRSMYPSASMADLGIWSWERVH